MLGKILSCVDQGEHPPLCTVRLSNDSEVQALPTHSVLLLIRRDGKTPLEALKANTEVNVERLVQTMGQYAYAITHIVDPQTTAPPVQ